MTPASGRRPTEGDKQMRFGKRAFALAALACALTVLVSAAEASPPGSLDLTGIASANAKAVGMSQPNILSPQLQEVIWAQGSYKLDGGTGHNLYYGYDDVSPSGAANAPFLPASGSTVEAQKTEPDKNTYLVLTGLHGADPGYDYGTHFLFQGHEATATGVPAAITRINLDADGAHRVTLLATQTQAGAPLHFIDGSTWDPWEQRLLFTTESKDTGGATPQPTPSIYQATPDFPSKVDDISNVVGRGGFEGVQNDNRGNLYLVEDIGGSTGTGANAFTKQPNSFLYRFLPTDPANLGRGGKLQALQVTVNGTPLTFTTPDADINSAGYVSLHDYGTSWPTKWITISTTTSSTPLPGADDNALAKAAGATPFKRPENGVFRPGSNFTEFWFDETGDTDNRTCAGGVSALPACTTPKISGGFGSVFKLTQSPTSDTGSISTFYNSDQAHAGFDNVTFFTRNQVAFVEDAGDTLHTERNALDSAYMFDVTADYSHGQQPTRFIAEGRDPSATIDSGLSGTGNEGDNEITGIHVSDGDPNRSGILGAKIPNAFHDGWRAFWTQQHGDNPTYELVAASKPHQDSNQDDDSQGDE
jgi:hypothetical protein